MGVLLLVRHGQASFGAEDYDVLSDLGVAQGRRLGEALAAEGVTPSLVVHGSMRRQQDTADSMMRGARWQLRTQVDSRWDEFDHLDVVRAHAGADRDATSDLDRREFQELFEQATTRWTTGVDDGEYAETFAGFVDRVGVALHQVAGSVGSGETAVVVTSGGVIAAVCGLLTLIPSGKAEIATVWQRFNTVTVNASVTRVLVGATGVRLLTFNEHTFLDRAQITYR